MAGKAWIHRAYCTCGWKGPRRFMPEEAARDWRAHYVTVNRNEFHSYYRQTGQMKDVDV